MGDIALSKLKGADTKRPFSLSNGGTIPTGTTDDFVFSCPTGKYVRITLLAAVNSPQSGVTLNCGGRDLFSGSMGQSGGAISPGQLIIGSSGGTSDSGYSQVYAQGGRDEDFTLSFAAATTRDIRYSYDIMEDDA